MKVSNTFKSCKRKNLIRVTVTNVPACMHICTLFVGKVNVKNKCVVIISIRKQSKLDFLFHIQHINLYLCTCECLPTGDI